MKNIRFIGDVHAGFNYYTGLIHNYDGTTIQVGDFGVGFADLPAIENNNWFIRGNHDNPELCNVHPQYLGDFGFREDLNLFFVGGAKSIDTYIRTEGVNWWRDEELTVKQFNDAYDLFCEKKPKIMVTHDCPVDIKRGFIRPNYPNDNWTHTQQALQAMWQQYQPDLWLFGHYHPTENRVFKFHGTTFVCLSICGVYDYEQ